MGKGRPQQQEIQRSGRTPVDPDHVEALAGDVEPRIGGPDSAGAGVPPDNRPGHRPDKDQDKPRALGGAGHGTGRKQRRK